MTEYERYIDDQLVRWGEWSRVNSINVGYKLGVLGRIRGSTISSVMISDEEGMMIDKAVSSLKDSEDLHKTAIFLYVHRMTYRQAAKKIHKSFKTVARYRQAIIDHVANSLKV